MVTELRYCTKNEKLNVAVGIVGGEWVLASVAGAYEGFSFV